MSDFVYPPSWSRLRQIPSARTELLLHVNDVLSWNEPSSRIKTGGADGLVSFIYDEYRLDDDPGRLVGELLFEDELTPMQEFVRAFDTFLNRYQASDPHLAKLHTADLPSSVVDSATHLYSVLKTHGVPRLAQD